MPVPTRWVAAARAEHRAPGPDALAVAGQRVVYSYPGRTPPENLLGDIRAGRAAGVIFFRDNYADPRQFATTVRLLHGARQAGGVTEPLLLMTDQEGGPVRRLPGAPELSARQVGRADDPTGTAAAAGTAAGRNLAGFGLNVNLAPVLDVHDTPDGSIEHHERSYGSDPARVGALGGAFIRAQQREGIAATAKHFPGLGAAPTRDDTDRRPVTLTPDAVTLRDVHLAPYREAVDAGVRLVMLSWAVYPALDADLPAGLSPAVVAGELRGRLGYRGVTITDALEAGALRDHGTTGERAVAAAAAGADVILCSGRDVAQGEEATAALADALASGRLDPAAFSAATGRIRTLRAELRRP